VVAILFIACASTQRTPTITNRFEEVVTNFKISKIEYTGKPQLFVTGETMYLDDLRGTYEVEELSVKDGYVFVEIYFELTATLNSQNQIMRSKDFVLIHPNGTIFDENYKLVRVTEYAMGWMEKWWLSLSHHGDIYKSVILFPVPSENVSQLRVCFLGKVIGSLAELAQVIK